MKITLIYILFTIAILLFLYTYINIIKITSNSDKDVFWKDLIKEKKS